jgi:hypothetical protein
MADAQGDRAASVSGSRYLGSMRRPTQFTTPSIPPARCRGSALAGARAALVESLEGRLAGPRRSLKLDSRLGTNCTVIKVGAPRGTESLHDSPLEGSAFELPVRGRGPSDCRSFAHPASASSGQKRSPAMRGLELPESTWGTALPREKTITNRASANRQSASPVFAEPAL